MATNVQDARQAILAGDVRARQFMRSFELRWNEPDLLAAGAVAFRQAAAGMPGKIMEQVVPGNWQKIQEMVKNG